MWLGRLHLLCVSVLFRIARRRDQKNAAVAIAQIRQTPRVVLLPKRNTGLQAVRARNLNSYDGTQRALLDGLSFRGRVTGPPIVKSGVSHDHYDVSGPGRKVRNSRGLEARTCS
jgi:hypothetical protein